MWLEAITDYKNIEEFVTVNTECTDKESMQL